MLLDYAVTHLPGLYQRHSMVHGECRGPVTWATPVRESLTPRAHNAGL